MPHYAEKVIFRHWLRGSHVAVVMEELAAFGLYASRLAIIKQWVELDEYIKHDMP